MLVAASPALGAGELGQASGATVCGELDLPLAQLARRLEPIGGAARTALIGLTQSADRGELLCGIRGLVALGDPRATPLLVAALKQPALRDDAYRLARWAAYLAGGAEPGLAAAMQPLVDVFADRSIRDAAGAEALLLFGEIDLPEARDRLVLELDAAADDATLDAIIHALARQGEPRVRGQLTALGEQAIREKSGNATPEQARRLGAIAFYQLQLGPDSLEAGLATLGTIALGDREWAASWTVHTLCARAIRRPAERAAIEAYRQALVAELDRGGIDWRAAQGPLPCAVNPR